MGQNKSPEDGQRHASAGQPDRKHIDNRVTHTVAETGSADGLGS